MAAVREIPSDKMRIRNIIIFVLAVPLWMGCRGKKLEEKGFAVSQETAENSDATKGIAEDSLALRTRPSSVLLTGHPQFRLTTIYKVNYSKRSREHFIGSNNFHEHEMEAGNGNQWHRHFMPGLEAVYGYNMVNIAHYNVSTQKRKDIFKSPVLVKTLYYPSFTTDTLNADPVARNYYLVSVYDEDTNKDKLISEQDLRRFYLFDIDAENRKTLVPENYSVLSSEYDPANDFMYVFAQLDKNKNGKRDEGEDIHIFWIDLKNPQRTGRQY